MTNLFTTVNSAATYLVAKIKSACAADPVPYWTDYMQDTAE